MLDIIPMLKETVDYLHSQARFRAEIGIILGSGLGRLGERIKVEEGIPYSQIPHFPVSTVPGHEGKLILGQLGGKSIIAMKGRFHYYEGYSLKEVTYPVRVMKRLGVKRLLISNAAGGINPSFEIGDVMMITDHINLMGASPIRGKHSEELGVRFPDMSDAYSKKLRALAREVALENNIYLHEGVYAGLSGPNFETAAEYRFLRFIGADAVGMSTVPEVIVAAQVGVSVLAFSVITDKCIPDLLEPVSHIKVLRGAEKGSATLSRLMEKIVEKL